jgi:hypothetical protein
LAGTGIYNPQMMHNGRAWQSRAASTLFITAFPKQRCGIDLLGSPAGPGFRAALRPLLPLHDPQCLSSLPNRVNRSPAAAPGSDNGAVALLPLHATPALPPSKSIGHGDMGTEQILACTHGRGDKQRLPLIRKPRHRRPRLPSRHNQWSVPLASGCGGHGVGDHPRGSQRLKREVRLRGS